MDGGDPRENQKTWKLQGRASQRFSAHCRAMPWKPLLFQKMLAQKLNQNKKG
jgi:hypothetical protein